MAAKTKKCRKCLKRLPLSAFGRCARWPDGLMTACRVCANAYYRARRGARRGPPRPRGRPPKEPAKALVTGRASPVEQFLASHALSCAVAAART